jgi:hypothetical protein
MPAYQGQQSQRDKVNDTSTMVQTRQLNGGNNAGATRVTTPMQCGGGRGQHNKDNKVSATRATVPMQCWQWHQHNEGNNTIVTMTKMPAY